MADGVIQRCSLQAQAVLDVDQALKTVFNVAHGWHGDGKATSIVGIACVTVVSRVGAASCGGKGHKLPVL